MSDHGIVLHGMEKKGSCAAEARATRSECPERWASQKQAVTKERSGLSRAAARQVTARLGQQETCQEAEMASESQPRPRLAACTSKGRLEVQAQWGRGGPSPQGPCLVAYKIWRSSAWLGCVRLGVDQAETRGSIPGLSPRLSAAPPQGLHQAVVGLVSAPNFTAWCLQVSQDPWAPAGPRRRMRACACGPCTTTSSSHLHCSSEAAPRPREVPQWQGSTPQAATKSQHKSHLASHFSGDVS